MENQVKNIKNSDRLAILFDLIGPEAFHTGYKKMTDSAFCEFVEKEKQDKAEYEKTGR